MNARLEQYNRLARQNQFVRGHTLLNIYRELWQEILRIDPSKPRIDAHGQFAWQQSWQIYQELLDKARKPSPAPSANAQEPPRGLSRQMVDEQWAKYRDDLAAALAHWHAKRWDSEIARHLGLVPGDLDDAMSAEAPTPGAFDPSEGRRADWMAVGKRLDMAHWRWRAMTADEQTGLRAKLAAERAAAATARADAAAEKLEQMLAAQEAAKSVSGLTSELATKH